MPRTSTCGWCATSPSSPSCGTSAAPPTRCTSRSPPSAARSPASSRLIGARLLDRTTQGTKLTEAGEVFLPQAKSLLRSAAQAAARARAAAEPSRITVGYMHAGSSSPRRSASYRRQYPDADAHAVHLDYREVRDALLDHRVDVAVARLPFPTDRLNVTILYDEQRVVIVPLDHRLAGRKYVTLDDIADEPLPRVRDSTRPGPPSGVSNRGRAAAVRRRARSSTRSRTSSRSSRRGRPLPSRRTRRAGRRGPT